MSLRLLTVVTLVPCLLGAWPARAPADDAEEGRLVTRLVRVQALTAGRTYHWGEGSPHGSNDEYAGLPPLHGRSGEEPLLPHGTVDELIELVKGAVRPAYWDDAEGADLRSAGAVALVVRAEPGVADAVGRFVADLERDVAAALTVDVQTLRLTRDETTALRLVPGEEALDSGRVAELLRGGRGGPAVSVATYAGLRVGAFGGVQRAWLGGAGARVAEASGVADPEVHVAHVGLAVTVEPQLVPGSDQVLVSVSAELSSLARSRDTPTEAAGSLETPVHDVVTVRAEVLARAGRWTLVGGTGPEGGEAHTYVLVRATPLERPAASRRAPGTALPDLPDGSGKVLEVGLFPVPALTVEPQPHSAWGTPLLPSAVPDFAPEFGCHSQLFPEEGILDLLRGSNPHVRWDDPANMDVRNGRLVLRNTPEVLGGVGTWLERLRAFALWTLEATVQVVDLPAEEAHVFPTGGPLLREHVVLLKSALATGTARRLAVAQLVSLSGVGNAVHAGRYVTYVRDYDPSIATKASVQEPVLGHYLDGVEVEVRPALSADGRSAQLEVLFQRTEPTGELRTVRVPGAGELGLPELETFRVRTAFHAALGVLHVAGSWTAEGRRRILLVTPRLR